MKAKLLYYSLFLAVFCGSCIKPVPPVLRPGPTQYMTQEFKDYTDFKKGSYWIYESNGNSVKRDSIVIISDTQFVENHVLPAPYERFTAILESSIDGRFTATGDGMSNDYHIEYPQWPNDETTYFTPINGVQLDDWGNMTLTDSSENLIVAGNKYQSVKEFTVNPNGGYKVISPITHIYWAKNVGVVQKTVSGITWQLIRYKVVQ